MSIMRKFQVLEDLKAEQKKDREAVKEESDESKGSGKRAASPARVDGEDDVAMVDEHEECERLAKRMKLEVPKISP